MIKDIEVRFEQTRIKSYQIVAFFEHIFISHTIDELQDPYCLANLLAFAQSILGVENAYPTGKYYAKRWVPGFPIWIAYETNARYTWDLRGTREDDGSALLLFKTGLPYQTKPKTKMALTIEPTALAHAIIDGFSTQMHPWQRDTA